MQMIYGAVLEGALYRAHYTLNTRLINGRLLWRSLAKELDLEWTFVTAC